MAKTKKTSVALLRDESGDWQGLFIDGKLYTQTHVVDLYTVLDRLEELGIVNFEVYEAQLKFKQPAYLDTLEKNAAAGIIDEPEPR